MQAPPPATTPAPDPNPGRPVESGPSPANPGIPVGPPLPPPITELNLPGFQLRVMGNPPPWVGNVRGPYPYPYTYPYPYPRVIVPPVQVGVGRPLQGVRDMVRGIIGGVLP